MHVAVINSSILSVAYSCCGNARTEPFYHSRVQLCYGLKTRGKVSLVFELIKVIDIGSGITDPHSHSMLKD